MNTLYDALDAPIPFDADRGIDALAGFTDLPENLSALVVGAAGCSPYLHHLLNRESNWLSAQLATPLDAVFEFILADIGGTDFQSLSDNLRQAKRRAALLVALADLGGMWSLEQVTGALTRLADRAVQVGLEHLVGAEIARGKLPGCKLEDAASGAGMVALAMGKMGAGELNYSSDIDLIMLFDESRHDPDNYGDLRAGFIRVTQRLVKLLSANTAEGYVFRTDLRLRPDPSVTPVCIAMEPAERYYESLGRTWERAAFIKARPCAGDIAAGWAFLERLRPFIWRKYLDFAAIEDAHSMRLRIREHKGLQGPIIIAGHDIKLGQGGIREIEFFTQTRQIISGGRDAEIRQRGTRAALAALVKNGWVEAELAADLDAAYVAHRTLEHRLQMLDDAQTHRIPQSLDKRERLATFCGAHNLSVFEADIKARLDRVHALTESFFAGETTEDPELPDMSERTVEIMQNWETLPALRSERSRRVFARLRPEILSRLARATSPDEALIQFDAFLSGLPAGVQIFSLFEANPHLLDLLVDICATAPELARYLGRHARVFEAVLGTDFFESLPSLEWLQSGLQQEIDTAGDYEQALDIARRWVKEQQFRIGVHLLRQISGAAEAAQAYSDVAEACLSVLFPVVLSNFAHRYGPAPGKGAAVIAMGKLGSREMTATSDLDLIVVYDAEGAAQSNGTRPLATGVYFARLTQALISALTVPTAEGALYEVDMRLRPSGRQGPVATTLAAFATYQKNDAWTWEHLALSRARVIAGRDDLVTDTEAAIRAALEQPHERQKVLGDVAEMRARLREAKPEAVGNVWELKHGAGALMDIELLLQTGAVLYGLYSAKKPAEMLPDLVACGWIATLDAPRILAAFDLFSSVQQVARLAVDGPIDPENIGQGLAALLLNVADVPNLAALATKLAMTMRDMAEIINKALKAE